MKKLKDIRKENTKLRLAVTMINLLVLGLFSFHHYYTGTEGLKDALRILEDVMEREKSKLIRDLALRDECKNEESPLLLYIWPGFMEGCMCEVRSGTYPRIPKDFLFLDKTCFKKTVKCLDKHFINMTEGKPLYRHTTGQYFCVK